MVVFPRRVLWISSVYWSATKVACVGGGRDYFSVTEVTSEVSTEVVFVTERLRGYLARDRIVMEVKCSYKPCWACCEVLCGITTFVWNKYSRILVVYSDIPVFWLDNKLPTTLKHRTCNIGGLSGSVEFKELFVCLPLTRKGSQLERKWPCCESEL